MLFNEVTVMGGVITGAVVTIAVGILCIVIGILNTKGNISMLHSYHRKRVTEADRLPFGRLVGLGMILIGISVIVGGVLMTLGELLEGDLFVIAGTVLMIVGLLAGIAVSFYAMIKYNKGIF